MGSVTVAKVSFLPNRDTGTLLDEKLALGDDNRLVRIVQVSGTFSVGGMPGVSSVTMNTAYVAFDAHTGNQLAVIA